MLILTPVQDLFLGVVLLLLESMLFSDSSSRPFKNGIPSTVRWSRERVSFWRSAAKAASVSHMLKISQITLEVK